MSDMTVAVNIATETETKSIMCQSLCKKSKNLMFTRIRGNINVSWKRDVSTLPRTVFFSVESARLPCESKRPSSM